MGFEVDEAWGPRGMDDGSGLGRNLGAVPRVEGSCLRVSLSAMTSSRRRNAPQESQQPIWKLSKSIISLTLVADHPCAARLFPEYIELWKYVYISTEATPELTMNSQVS